MATFKCRRRTLADPSCLESSLLSLVSSMAAIVFLLVSSAALSQQSAANLNGAVRDLTGAVVQGATVSLANLATGVKHETITNESGVYTFTNVLPGDYSLTVSKEGFSPATHQNMHTQVNQSITQDFELKPGATATEVIVQATSAELNTANASIGEVIETKSVHDLPLNGRNFTPLMTLVPGVAPVNTGQSSTGGQTNPLGAFVAPSINGQEVRSNYYLLDGIDNTEVFYGVPVIPPVIDDIQEFKVQGHNDEAQFGGVVGGIVNVVTKSGTNQIHGAVWEYVRNTIFNANNPISKLPQKLVQNQFGFNGGGPFYIPHVFDGRNKSFVFASYEGVRRASPQPNAFYMVPTAKQLLGDFSEICPGGFDNAAVCLDRGVAPGAPPGFVCTPGAPTSPTTCVVAHQLYDPFSTDPLNQNIRNPFPNNNLAGAINPQALAYVQAYFPAPLQIQSSNGQLYNGIDSRSLHTSQNLYSIRGDHTFNNSNTAFFRYSTMTQPNLGPQNGLLSGSLLNNSNFNVNRIVYATQWASNFAHSFGPSAVLDVEFGHSNLTNSQIQTIQGGTLRADTVIKDAGFVQSFACNLTGGLSPCSIPFLYISNTNNIPNGTNFAGGGENEATALLSNLYQWRGNFTKTLQKHAFSTGFSWENDSFHLVLTSNALVVTNSQTASAQNPSAGNALASLLLGVVDNGQRQDTLGPLRGQHAAGFYLMDKWKVTDRLTLNLGLRADLQYNGVYGETNSGTIYVGNVDFNNGTYVLQKAPGDCTILQVAPCIPFPGGALPAHVLVSKNGHLFDNNYGLQPRIGLAYRLTDNTALRAGFGVFNDLWGGTIQRIQNISGTWPTLGHVFGSSVNDVNSVATVNFQDPLAVLGNASIPGPDPFANPQWYQDPHNKMPYSEQWNLGFEQKVGSTTVLTANYVGSQTHDLIVGGLYNVARTPNSTPNATTAEIMTTAPYPYINPTFWDHSVGNASYNALQLSANRRALGGLSYIVSYTWSKTVNLGCDGFFGIEGCSVPNPYDLKADRSVAGTDLTHVFTAGITADSPVGKGKRFSTGSHAVDYIVGNWQFNTIAIVSSGQPYTVVMDNTQTSLANDINHNIPWDNFNRPNLVGNPNSSTCPGPGGSTVPVHTPGCWISPSAFALPGRDAYGNSARNFLRGDGLINFDLSIFRSFPLGEKRSLQFRAEGFNVLNHPTWGNPNVILTSSSATTGDGFGAINSTRSTERQLQFALKMTF